ncbi:MAG: CvpA family protein [Tannerellaceae bacterium]|jgi:membrane protein required for colicin V production|nr:CvpA family protein [Tannerellaceae bacterium]
MMGMNWLDMTLLCLAGVGLVKGLFDGIIKQVVSLIALILSIYFCSEVAGWLRDHIVAWGWFPEGGVTVACYILAFLLIVGIFILTGEIMHRLIGVTPLGILNHLAGGLFGLLVMVLFVSLLLNVMEIADRGSALIPVEAKVESRLYYSVKEIVPKIYARFR